jgi:hypothetical protein
MTPGACCYEIRVAEPVEDHWLAWFPDAQISVVPEASGPGTLLRGSLPDQAALFGVLARVRDLNLTLLEVRRIPDDKGPGVP